MDRPRPAKAEIPDKTYFKIGEVSEIAGVDAHVLRFWEKEFPSIKPNRELSKQRLYRREDVETILHIKELLYEEGFTIAGARKLLRKEKQSGQQAAEETEITLKAKPFFEKVKGELQEIKKILEK